MATSTHSDKTILVTGITGKEGGAVARSLLKDGWKVRGLSRNLNKPEVKALQESGINVVQGDMDDRATLDAAMKGVYGVFSVRNFWLPQGCADGEIRPGKLVAHAAK